MPLQQGTDQKAQFIKGFCGVGSGVFQSGLGLKGLLWPDLGVNSEIDGILFLSLGLGFKPG